MFGDAGHGFLMALIAAFLIYKEGPISADKKEERNIWNAIRRSLFVAHDGHIWLIHGHDL
jgi:vacuolar-type H+-ATPase subunit I/STV1